jgi:hypothetical protein
MCASCWVMQPTRKSKPLPKLSIEKSRRTDLKRRVSFKVLYFVFKKRWYKFLAMLECWIYNVLLLQFTAPLCFTKMRNREKRIFHRYQKTWNCIFPHIFRELFILKEGGKLSNIRTKTLLFRGTLIWKIISESCRLQDLLINALSDASWLRLTQSKVKL